MLSKHKKTEVPAWQRRLVVILASLFGATFLLFLAWAVMLYIERDQIEGCLDQGGSIDHERSDCGD